MYMYLHIYIQVNMKPPWKKMKWRNTFLLLKKKNEYELISLCSSNLNIWLVFPLSVTCNSVSLFLVTSKSLLTR